MHSDVKLVTLLAQSQPSIISDPLLYSSLKLSGPNTAKGKQNHKDKLINLYIQNVKSFTQQLLDNCGRNKN